MSDKIEHAGLSAGQRDLLARVEHRLMAPCCYTQTIDLHMSDIAQKMRQECASMILAGQTQTQVYQHYKAIYGEQILAVPDGLLGTAAFAIPLTVASLATGALTLFLYRFHRRKLAVSLVRQDNAGSVAVASATIPDIDKLRERIREETAW